MVCPVSFVECLTVARIECSVLKEAMLSLSGSCCFCLYTLTLLLSAITISFRVLRVGYFSGFGDLCKK